MGSGEVTKNSLHSLHKFDSVLRESLRMHPHHLFGIDRHIGVDLRLSDGTVIPAGSFTGVATYAMNFDPTQYEKPHEFDGFRFDQAGEKMDPTAHLTTSRADWIGFVHGKHACPGRYFAANEVCSTR